MQNKKLITVITFVLLGVFLNYCSEQKKLNWTLVPYPNYIMELPGVFSFNKGVSISYDDNKLLPTVEHFKKKFKNLGINTTKKSPSGILLQLVESDTTNTESYELIINSEHIKVIASNTKGIFYGLMTIWQQLSLSNSMEIPLGRVKDSPRFEYRGFMLDESRHFFGKEKVKEVLDMMSLLKLNTFHWHLTDAPGWRIEIKAYPKLTTIGGLGSKSDPDAPVQYYTQEEIKEIVVYAAERNIIIIPEIDMPGHATAANRAYPEFSGGGVKSGLTSPLIPAKKKPMNTSPRYCEK